jgi:flagellar hook-associated protein 3 FlgL
MTGNIIKRTAIDNLGRNLREIVDAQRKISSGKRIDSASDDPTAAAGAMRASSSIRAIAQYQRNIDSSKGRLDLEEGVLDRLTESIERAKELSLAQAGSTGNQSTRAIAKVEVDQLLAFAKDLANTRHEGEFLFGGTASATQPITSTTPPFTASPPTGSRQNEIQSGMFMKTNHNATEIFLDTGTLAALEQLSTALGNNDGAAVGAAADALDTAHAGLQNLVGEVGVRSSQLEITSANLSALDVQLQSIRSNLQDVELEKTVTELAQRQTAYQTAMLATSRLMGMSLADYLT